MAKSTATQDAPPPHPFHDHLSQVQLEEGHRLNHKRTSISVSGLALLNLSFQALGIIYSDIGTSPLYALNGIWPVTGPAPSREDVIGGISAIIWALTLLPLVKYVLISLEFGTDEGEGGPFALFLGLYPKRPTDPSFDRSLTFNDEGDQDVYTTTTTKKSKTHLLESQTQELRTRSDSNSNSRLREMLRFPCMVWCLFGTALTLADGVFTPAVSVTSAVGGIAVAKPEVTQNIIPISIGFLIALFCIQRFGTSGLATVFAPIAFIWFILLIGVGIYNITLYPGIFRAFDPSRAVLLFVRTGNYDILSGVVLALTGCEAMFANLGQFNALSIRLSFSFLVYPAIVIAYLGQGACLIVDGENVVTNIFYKSIPGPSNGPLFWVVFVFGILATLVASQSLITATFSLFQQLINTKYFPPLLLTYTSQTIQGQIYIPFINYSLMIITLIVVASFANLTNLSNAYGFSVATVMFSTTVLLAIHMRFVKRWWWSVAVGYFLVFGFLDGLFWGASLKKVPEGAWVSLVIGVVLAVIMVFWAWAKGLEDSFDSHNRQSLRQFVSRVRIRSIDSNNDGDGESEIMLASPGSIQIEQQPIITVTGTGLRGSFKETLLTSEVLDSSTNPEWDSWKYYINTPVTRTSSSINRLSGTGTATADFSGPSRRRRFGGGHAKQASEEKELEGEEDSSTETRWIRKEIVRVPTMAVFHKLTAGRGVPHTFVGLISQWHALPQVLVFLSVCLIPMARVPVEDRYVVKKVDDLDGFYAVTYNLGFRDDFDVRAEELVEVICAIERGRDPKNSDGIIETIRQVSERPSHIVPHYHVCSSEFLPESNDPSMWTVARLVVMNKVRKYLIEEIYRRLATMFPETANWGNSADEIIHVGINANI
ncbi:potassium transporter [Dendrothele bispora CBS 962.96]|uniref:Potassium transporter n=1 Tax=Dendrothele bispora (strain CBS 962.96) TaxID=1314807 RepID=A0A4S8M147_DENBC|nr:potassium transporter [Dendrothele bispora CBS 962.96]